MKVPGNAGGKTFKCVKCGALITVDAAVAPASPPESPASTPLPQAAEPLGQLLLNAGCITALQLDEALGVQQREGGKTFEILIRLGFLDKARLHEVLSHQTGVAGIELSRVSIDREMIKLVSKEMALAQLVLPIDKLGKLLTVAMACPLDVATIADLEESTGLKVKAMLCRYDDIRTAVTKYYPEDGRATGELHTFQMPEGYDRAPKDDVSDKLGRLEDLNYRSETLAQLAEVITDSESKLEHFIEALASDPATAAALMRTANSAAYGMAGQVDSLTLAVTLLGREGVAGVVAHCKKVNVGGPDNLAAIQDRAATVAQIAAALARASGRSGREISYTAGLLLGVGSLALATVAQQRYAKINTSATGAELAQGEKEAFGIDHTDAAQILLKRWRFPESLQLSVGRYLSPDTAQAQANLAALLRAAATGTLESAAEAAGVKPDAMTRARREEEQQREILNAARI